jgi:hypothetical protein
MTTPTVIEVDCSTGISTERPMTADEIQAMEERTAAFAVEQAARDAEAAEKAAAKASAEAKLAALGLTSEEIAAL